ncbi:MAG: photosynthetic complex putative assembly protein PuhB, partial [Pseudomonadota bacterium]
IYLVLLAVIGAALGNFDAVAFVVTFGALAIGILYAAAWLTVRNTYYILTDVRLILRIGMAVDKRINLPLKKVGAAHLSDRGKGFGDIALEPVGDHVLSYALLWPHARPLKFAHPQPMLRAIPDAAEVARILADATARYEAIELSELGKIDPDQSLNAPELAGATA